MLEIIYFIISIFVGLLGSRHFGGFILWFILSFLLTAPLVLLVLIILAKPRHQPRQVPQ